MSRKNNRRETRIGHRWVRPEKLRIELCWRCGLVALKNEATAKAIRAGCYPEKVEEDVES